MKKYNNKNNLGITLIALIVTIIVLIILAGISISLINSDNSVLKRTIESKELYDRAQNNELQTLKELSDEFPYPVIPVDTEATRNSVTKKKDVSSSNPVIPKGFKAINVGEAIWGTSDGYKKGLVIEDVGKDENTRGSQFVWVPVENYNDFHAIEGFYGANRDSYLTTILEAGDSKETGKPTVQNVNGTDESIAMYNSVKRFKGFYIARYEAGISGTVDNGGLSEATESNGEIKPLSKPGCGVWNSIPWGSNNDENTASDGLVGDDSADGVVKVARSMYNSSDYGAKSTLCYGVQWDATLNFLDSNYLNGKPANDSIVKNASGKGYYRKSAPSLTGYYAEKNIFDLAGNVYEMTMETGEFVDGLNSRVSRGGAYGGYANKHAASLRVVKSTDFLDRQFGFRVALIID